MTRHNVYVLTNADHEAYFMVRKTHFTFDSLYDRVTEARAGYKNFEKKNPVLSRFVLDNLTNGLVLERMKAPVELNSYDEVCAYRDQVTEEYLANGYLVLDEAHYELMDSPADTNFAEVNKRMDMGAAMKKFAKESLMKARKSLTVGEFLAYYG